MYLSHLPHTRATVNYPCTQNYEKYFYTVDDLRLTIAHLQETSVVQCWNKIC